MLKSLSETIILIEGILEEAKSLDIELTDLEFAYNVLKRQSKIE